VAQERGEHLSLYRSADKSLARPGRKQARKHVRGARDFNIIETRAVIKFFSPARQGAEENSRHSDRNISLFPSWSGYGLISTPVYIYIYSKNYILTRYINVQTRGNPQHVPVIFGHLQGCIQKRKI